MRPNTTVVIVMINNTINQKTAEIPPISSEFSFPVWWSLVLILDRLDDMRGITKLLDDAVVSLLADKKEYVG